MRIISLKKRKLAKLLIAIAVLLFVFKPFLGFALFSRLHPPVQHNVFVKAFSKRNLEDSENSDSNVKKLQTRLADPVLPFTLLFSFLLDLIFPAVFAPGPDITYRVLWLLKLRPYPGEPAYLLNGKLTI